MKFAMSSILALSLILPALWPSVLPAAEADGFIYGVITTRSGNSYSGVIRWESEESFWDDIFHSAKEELPFARLAEEDEREHGEHGEQWWEAFGRKMKVVWGGESRSRVFAARFGDIDEIRVTGTSSAELTMRSGEKIPVSGYANDVGATLVVLDQTLGRIEVPWRKIETVSFGPTPSDAELPGRRIYGTVHTDAGEFSGFLQWDSQECLDVDELDGDTDDGRLSIEFGKISRIERRSSRSSKVTLTDGRELVLDGTNDVNSSIRGILVEDPRFGKVKIPWSAFDRVELSTDKGSGKGYREFGGGAPLQGTVTTRSGEKPSGVLVYDVDESASWEMLDGTAFDIEYHIPFALIASIEPRGSSSARVTLMNGEKLRLEDSQDVSERNDGVVVIDATATERYLPWREIQEISFVH